ncbi:hypothetical protein [Limnohabitans sp. T6-20]|jgi:hypothetical protein|uniref:hypothetical protein n=1 Tax=Limnohabitans sp. T6-20 TaxID=1100725 RepID=UPI0018EEB9A4|nr:hypothetical protein [Limnohabitans sp. T6-20]
MTKDVSVHVGHFMGTPWRLKMQRMYGSGQVQALGLKWTVQIYPDKNHLKSR